MQQEKVQEEEETAVMRTKGPMEDEETEAKRPRVEDEPKNSINSDIDVDEAELELQEHGEGLRLPMSKRSATVRART